MTKTKVTTDVADELAEGLAADLAALVNAPRYRPGPPCSIGALLRKLAGTRALDRLEEILGNETVPASQITITLAKRGVAVSTQSVSRHRRRGQHNGCRCEP